jgi:hypothetical protein
MVLNFRKHIGWLMGSGIVTKLALDALIMAV